MDKSPKNKDDENLINNELLEQIQDETLGPNGSRILRNYFDNFTKSEPNCARSINRVIHIYGTVLLNSAVQRLAVEGQEIPTEQVKEYADLIGDSLRMVMAAGMIYGKARLDHEFMKTIRGSELEARICEIQNLAEQSAQAIDLNEMMKNNITPKDLLAQLFDIEFEEEDDEEDPPDNLELNG